MVDTDMEQYLASLDTEEEKRKREKSELKTCPMCGDPIYVECIREDGYCAGCHPDFMEKELHDENPDED